MPADLTTPDATTATAERGDIVDLPGAWSPGDDDPHRLEAVHRLDPGRRTTGHEGDEILDGIVSVAAALLDMPMAFISILDDEHQWLRTRHGIDITDTSRRIAICHHVVVSGEPLVLPDAAADPRLAGNPLVGPDGIGCYIGVPLRSNDGQVVGTLCCADGTPRPIDTRLVEPLMALGQAVVSHLELADAMRQLGDHANFFQSSPDLHCVARRDGSLIEANDSWRTVLGWEPETLDARHIRELTHPDDIHLADHAIGALRAGQQAVSFRVRVRHADGDYRWLDWIASANEDATQVLGTARDVTAFVQQAEAIERSNSILSIIAECHASLLAGGATSAWWGALLDRLLEVTGSEYGFLGYTGVDDEGPFLRSMAITDISWDEASRQLYAASIDQGFLFRNTSTLFGEVLLTRRPVVANEVESDPRAGGRPHGHPPLNRFLGLPIGEGNEMVGMVGLANRATPYDDALIAPLAPLLAFLRAVIDNLRMTEHAAHIRAEIDAVTTLQDRILEASDAGIVAVDADGIVSLTNERARRILPATARPGARLVDCLLDEADRRWALGALTNADEATHRLAGIGDRGVIVPCDARLVPLGSTPGDGFVLRIADASAQVELDRSAADNLVLQAQLEQLHRQRQQDHIVVEAVEMLQASSCVDEALELVRRAVGQLFPDADVTLYLGAASDDLLGHHAGPTSESSEIGIRQCWALRTRRSHGSWPGGPNIPCRHGDDADDVIRFCLPLSLGDDQQALVVITSESRTEPNDTETAFARVAWMTQSLSGALTNVALRLRLEQTALADPLTDLPNRRSFHLEVERRRSRAKRTGASQLLALIDVDHFKEINDEFGHDEGDRILRSLARALRQGARGSDIPGRLGGDEFAVFLDEIDPTDGLERIEQIRNLINTSCTTGRGPVTVSIGVIHSGDLPVGAGHEAMITAADDALYTAKRQGRDTVVRWQPAIAAR